MEKTIDFRVTISLLYANLNNPLLYPSKMNNLAKDNEDQVDEQFFVFRIGYRDENGQCYKCLVIDSLVSIDEAMIIGLADAYDAMTSNLSIFNHLSL